MLSASSEVYEGVMLEAAEELAKLVYIVESVFVTLCFHGFCGS